MSDRVYARYRFKFQRDIVLVFGLIFAMFMPRASIGADPLVRESLVRFFDRIALSSYNSIYLWIPSVGFDPGSIDPTDEDRIGRWFVEQVKDAVVMSGKISFHVLDPYESTTVMTANTVDRKTVQYSLNPRVSRIPTGLKFTMDFVDTFTTKLIDRDSFVIPSALVDAETASASPLTAWTATFSSANRRQEWITGTNETGFKQLENWIVDRGRLRQTELKTSIFDPRTNQYTSGYSSLTLKDGYRTPILSQTSVLAIMADVEIGDRDPYLEEVGVISFGFAYAVEGGTGDSRVGTFWLQNAFSRLDSQDDARKIFGIVMDGNPISSYEGAAFFDGYSSPLTKSEIAKSQESKRITYRIELDLWSGKVVGSIKFDGDSTFTPVGIYSSPAIKGFTGSRLVIKPIIGCISTISAFDSVSIEIR